MVRMWARVGKLAVTALLAGAWLQPVSCVSEAQCRYEDILCDEEAQAAFLLLPAGVSRWIAAGNNGTIMYFEKRTLEWKQAPATGTTENLQAVALDSSGKSVSVALNQESIHSTNGGQTWSMAPYSGATSLTGIDSDGTGLWVAAGSSGSVPYIAKSADDGLNWNSVNPGGTSGLRSVHYYGNQRWVVIGGTGESLCYYSTDSASNWNACTLTTGVSAIDLAGDSSGRLVMVGVTDSVAYSTDGGLSWTNTTTGAGISWKAIATDNNGRWIAVGGGGMTAHSTDGGQNWTSSDTGSGINLNGIATDGRLWIAVGDAGTYVYSIDGGITWKTGMTGTAEILNDITHERLL